MPTSVAKVACLLPVPSHRGSSFLSRHAVSACTWTWSPKRTDSALREPWRNWKLSPRSLAHINPALDLNTRLGTDVVALARTAFWCKTELFPTRNLSPASRASQGHCRAEA
ncbi:hypothetical protein VULLAG_LOCUS17315 [Vulpes lagopus]